MTQLGDPDDMAVSDAHGLGVGRFQSPAPKDRRLSSSPLVDNLPFAVDALSITTKLNVLTPTRQMSEGQTARVFRARGPDGGDYAVKILARDRDAERRAANEVCLLRQLKHDHIVKLVDYEQTPDCLFVVQELCETGDLHDYIYGASRPLDETQIARWVTQLLEAMVYIHKQDIAHRDIKLENMAVGRDGSIKLIDFGYASHTGRSHSTIRGTERYMAPEIFCCAIVDLKKADVWAAGIVLAILLEAMVLRQHHPNHHSDANLVSLPERDFPWACANVDCDEQYMLWCRAGEMAPRFWSHFSIHAQATLKLILTVAAFGRPTAADALRFMTTQWPQSSLSAPASHRFLSVP